ncbi:pentapeptide repeat-containing protein [bacterium]|nr:pentapeptide repeat-containing protein [bacterium]
MNHIKMLGNQKKEIAQLKADLLEQEHRLYYVLKAYFIDRKDWAKDDPRQLAVKKALIFRIIFSPTTVAAIGGILAILSLILLLHQNILIDKQNTLIKEQNRFFQNQILYDDIERHTKVVYGDSDTYPHGRKIISLRRLIYSLRTINSNSDSKINLANANLSGLDLSEMDLSNIDFTDTDFRGANFTDVNLKGSILIGCSLTPLNYSDSSFRGVLHEAANGWVPSLFINTNIEAVDFSLATVDNAIFIDVNMKDVVYRKEDPIREESVGYDNYSFSDSVFINPINLSSEIKESFYNQGAIFGEENLSHFVTGVEDGRSEDGGYMSSVDIELLNWVLSKIEEVKDNA